jgi:hypothetical protein
MKAILAILLSLFAVTTQAGEIYFFKGSQWEGTVGEFNAAEGWVKIASNHTNYATCKVQITDLDAATRIRHGMPATDNERLQYANAKVQSELDEAQRQIAFQQAQAASATHQAQQQAAMEQAQRREYERQVLELQQRQTEILEQVARQRGYVLPKQKPAPIVNTTPLIEAYGR